MPKVPLPPSVLELSELGLDSLAEEHLRGFEDQVRKSHGAAADGVLCELYGELQSATRRYRIAQTATSLDVLLSEPEANSLWQSHCAYPRPYLALVQKAAEDSRVRPAFIFGVMRQESAFRPEVVSSAEAVGLMQLIPPTAARVAEELAWPEAPKSLTLPAVNLRLGAHYLGKLSRMFRERSELAAAAYNAGPLSVATWLRGSPGLPLDLFLAKIPYEETRTYVHRVIGNTARYLYLEGVDPKEFDSDSSTCPKKSACRKMPTSRARDPRLPDLP